jgi:hypothetical protein
MGFQIGWDDKAHRALGNLHRGLLALLFPAQVEQHNLTLFPVIARY